MLWFDLIVCQCFHCNQVWSSFSRLALREQPQIARQNFEWFNKKITFSSLFIKQTVPRETTTNDRLHLLESKIYSHLMFTTGPSLPKPPFLGLAKNRRYSETVVLGGSITLKKPIWDLKWEAVLGGTTVFWVNYTLSQSYYIYSQI